MKSIEKNDGVQLFENSFLEALTKTSPLITLITYSSFITLLLVLSYYYTSITFTQAMITYAAGLLVWSLFEYLMHRYLFHLVSEIAWVKRIPYLLHGVHHEAPRDESRLFMPPVPGAIIVSLLLGISWLIMRSYSFSFVAGLVNGYMFYAAMHYSMHVFKAPPMLRKLWAHHALHHYKHHDKAFGVSTMLWDRIFRTMPPVKEQKSVVVGADPGASAGKDREGRDNTGGEGLQAGSN